MTQTWINTYTYMTFKVNEINVNIVFCICTTMTLQDL